MLEAQDILRTCCVRQLVGSNNNNKRPQWGTQGGFGDQNPLRIF